MIDPGREEVTPWEIERRIVSVEAVEQSDQPNA
jgi:hypothetical protein